MLNTVPTGVNFSARQVVLRHPNSVDCVVYRKVLTRVEDDGSGNPETMGDFPTLGGLGMVDSEDEADFEYEDLGEGRALIMGVFEPPQDTADHNDSLTARQQQEAQIVASVDPSDPAYFTAEKHDLVVMMLGEGIGLTYEIMGTLGSINIPPYNRRYILNPRDDLHQLEPFASE